MIIKVVILKKVMKMKGMKTAMTKKAMVKKKWDQDWHQSMAEVKLWIFWTKLLIKLMMVK